MTTPFAPKGEVPEWRMIYDALLEAAEYGDVISYPALDDALGRPFVPNRSPIYRARRELGALRRRWLEAVPRVGYRVIEANEHLRVADGHKRKARTQLRAMVRVADVTDLARLSAEELHRFDAQARHNAMLYMVAVHHEQRLARIEEVLRREGML